ncbi:hypothetical protein ACPTGL_14715, partial [Enterococcus faecalis]
EATFLLTEAECAAALVARQTPVEISVVKGTTLYQKKQKEARFLASFFVMLIVPSTSYPNAQIKR